MFCLLVAPSQSNRSRSQFLGQSNRKVLRNSSHGVQWFTVNKGSKVTSLGRKRVMLAQILLLWTTVQCCEKGLQQNDRPGRDNCRLLSLAQHFPTFACQDNPSKINCDIPRTISCAFNSATVTATFVTQGQSKATVNRNKKTTAEVASTLFFFVTPDPGEQNLILSYALRGARLH